MPEVTGAASKTEQEPADSVASTESIKLVANGNSENGVSSTSPEKKSPEKNEGEILLAQGKRHLYVKDYPNAVASLGDACAKLTEIYGDLADECADAFFSYGRALLELAREESTGNVLGTDPEKDESDDGEEEGEGEEQPKPDSEAEAKVEGDKDDVEKADKEGEKESAGDETIDTTKEINEAEDADEEKEDDVDNLQLAWEVFEVAKTIFERQKANAKLAETYFYLGEVELESENYNGAIEDMKHCIKIQEEILPPDHRDIAETYFQLGVACSLCNAFDDAISNFKTSSEILENRINNLEKNGPSEEEKAKNPFYSVEKEVEEIKALLPEIKAKVSDMEDFKRETIKNVMASLFDKPPTSDGAGPSSSASSSASASAPASSAAVSNGTTPKPATDISHLIRKKRKPDNTPSDSSTKKQCSGEADK